MEPSPSPHGCRWSTADAGQRYRQLLEEHGAMERLLAEAHRARSLAMLALARRLWRRIRRRGTAAAGRGAVS